MARYYEDFRRRRFRALIDGFEKAHPTKPLPPLSHYSKMIGVDLRTLRDWAKQDFADIYMQTEGWPSLDELGKAMAERSRLHAANGERKITLADPDPKKIAASAATFSEEAGLPWS